METIHLVVKAILEGVFIASAIYGFLNFIEGGRKRQPLEVKLMDIIFKMPEDGLRVQIVEKARNAKTKKVR